MTKKTRVTSFDPIPNETSYSFAARYIHTYVLCIKISSEFLNLIFSSSSSFSLFSSTSQPWIC